ncbi:histone family protein [Methanobrevibacter sp.]|uniref:histone family protein n=1 Tax=Methanobrevibacter sp. TaxID=66852 RepID=UPI00388FE839
MAIPKAPVKRIIQEEGAERVSADAVDALVAYLEADADAVAKKAIEYATIAKRQTVKAEDIALATGVTTTSDTPAENEHNLFDVIKKVIESAEEGKGFEDIIKSFIKFDKK